MYSFDSNTIAEILVLVPGPWIGNPRYSSLLVPILVTTPVTVTGSLPVTRCGYTSPSGLVCPGSIADPFPTLVAEPVFDLRAQGLYTRVNTEI